MSRKTEAAEAKAEAKHEAKVAKATHKAEAISAVHEDAVAAFDELTIGGDGSPLIVGGWFDSLLQRLLASVKFDWHKMDAKELKAAITSAGDGMIGFCTHTGNALKPAVDSPAGVDDIAINKVVDLEVAGINALIAMAVHQVDVLFPQGGVFMAQTPMTKVDVQDWMNSLTNEEVAMGRPVTQHNAQCVEKIMANPELVRVIKRLSKKRQMRALIDLGFLDKIIAFWEKYGSTILQIFSFILMFL